MMQTPARARITRAQDAVTRSFPAPVGGLNDREPLGAMAPDAAVILTNFWCMPSKVALRQGCSAWATGMGSQVESLMGYRPSTGSPALFAAAGANFYNASVSGGLSNYVNLPGAAGDHASTPDSAALDITGNIEIIAYAASNDWTPAAEGAFFSKWDGGGQQSYIFSNYIDGTLRLIISSNGSNLLAVDSSVATGFTDGTGHWVRVTRNSTTGVVNFYTAEDSSSAVIASIAWVQLGTTQTLSAGTSMNSGTASGNVGASNAGTALPFSGKIYSAYVYNGIGGTLVASMVANDTFAGDTSWPSLLTGETWTVNGAATVAGSVVQTGLTNARWQHVNMATAGGSFLMAVNGADKLRGWNGTAWWVDGDATHDITGVDTATCVDILTFKRRMWLIKGNSTSAYYGPVDGIAGAFTELPFGSIFQDGGKLKKMVNWSIDAGIGIDDYAAFISDQGEVALYKGSDPSSATTWALVGTFKLGSPVGQRCAIQYGKDVLLVGKDGMVPLSVALLTQRLLTNIALTDKIQNAISAATTTYGSNFGWEIVAFPGENMIILNVPVGVGQQIQYAMNTISGAWAKFSGWAANCFEIYGDELFYGGSGAVYKAWDTRADAGANINAEALAAFNYFGTRDSLKYFTLARPLISITADVGLNIGLNTDFDLTPPTGVPTVTSSTAGKWGTARWGIDTWGGNPVIQKSWYSAVGVGYCAALHIKAATNAGQCEWAATDYAFKPGGVL